MSLVATVADTWTKARETVTWKSAAVTVAAVIAARVAFGLVRKRQQDSRRERIIGLTRARLQQQIAVAQRFVAMDPPLQAEVDKYSNMTIAQLVRAQRDRDVTTTKLLRIFFQNAISAHAQTNCLTVIDAEVAINDAVRCDGFLKHLKPSSEAFPPLFGIVCSVKDCVNLRGQPTTLGFVSEAMTVPDDDAALVTLLRKAGAIVAMKGNVPQSMMSYECINDLFGPTTNPVGGKLFSPGGSSGGDAAVVKLRGAVFSIGTDIGGSIRIPSHFCGVAGLKPSQFRVPSYGLVPAIPGQEGVATTAGPMAKTVEDLVAVTQVLVPRSPSVNDGVFMGHPFNAARYDAVTAAARSKQLVLGVIYDDGIAAPSPACRRALDLAVAAAKKQGAIVVEIHGSAVLPRAFELFYEIISSDSCDTLRKWYRNPLNKPEIHVARSLAAASRTFRFFSPIIGFAISTKDRLLGHIIYNAKRCTVSEYYELIGQRNNVRHSFNALLNERNVDAVLCPAFIVPAVRTMASVNAFAAVSHTAVYNVLDVAAVMLPVTNVTKEEVAACRTQHWDIPKDSPAVNNNILHREAKAMYLGIVEGLPVGVQIVGRRQDEEGVLACAAFVESALKQ